MKKIQYMAPETVSIQIQSAVSLCGMFSAGGGDNSFFQMSDQSLSGAESI